MGVGLPRRLHALVPTEVLGFASIALVHLSYHPPASPVRLEVVLLDIDLRGRGQPFQYGPHPVGRQRRRDDIVLPEYRVDGPEILNEASTSTSSRWSRAPFHNDGPCDVAKRGQPSLAGRWTFFSIRRGCSAGDGIGEPELETVAAREGNHAVKNAFGNEGVTIDYDAVPAVVFTSPEVASVGSTELEYMDEHGTCSCRTVQMENVPRAKAVENTDGLVQVMKHHETDEIVGVRMVGPRAADMIMEATLAVKFGLTVGDIIDTVHPFPTFSEAFKHACQTFRRDTSTMSCCVE